MNRSAGRVLVLAWLMTIVALPVAARDTTIHLPLAAIETMPQARGKLDGSVKFFLAGQTTPTVVERLNTLVANRKTNGFGTSDQDGCRWAALSALIALQDKAKAQGANAVVDIVSYYKKNEVKSSTDYECHAGAVVVGVALKGTLAKIAP